MTIVFVPLSKRAFSDVLEGMNTKMTLLQKIESSYLHFQTEQSSNVYMYLYFNLPVAKCYLCYVAGVQLGGSWGLEPCPFRQRNKSALFVVSSLYQEGAFLRWKGVIPKSYFIGIGPLFPPLP